MLYIGKSLWQTKLTHSTSGLHYRWLHHSTPIFGSSTYVPMKYQFTIIVNYIRLCDKQWILFHLNSIGTSTKSQNQYSILTIYMYIKATNTVHIHICVTIQCTMQFGKLGLKITYTRIICTHMSLIETIAVLEVIIYASYIQFIWGGISAFYRLGLL